MSAAFDIVDHDLLLKKLQLYGFKEDAISWVGSYLSDRKQCVCIDGCLSKMLPVSTGVPQGSILGPIFFILFTNELPDIVQDHLVEQEVGEIHQHQGVEGEEFLHIPCPAQFVVVFAAMQMIPPTPAVVRTHRS